MKMKWLYTLLLLLLGATRLAAQGGTADTTSELSAEIAVVNSVSKDNGATWSDAQLAPGLHVNPGDQVRYLIQIVNIGDFPVADPVVTSTMLDMQSCVLPDTLEPAGLIECIVGPVSAPAGQSVNTVLVTALYNDEVVSAADSAYVYAGEVAVLSVEKLAGIGGTWYAADSPPGFSVPASREVRFRVVVTNEGTYPFTNITISDTMLTFTGCEIPSVLPPGDSFQCSTERIEVRTGAQVNTVTVTAVANGQTYSVSDSAHFVVAADLHGDIITVEGPVVSIEANVIVVADRTIVLRRDDPLLALLDVGDIVRVEGTVDGRVLVALFILIVDTDIYIGGDPDEVYLDDGNCGNPPPPWAPAHGWRRKCQLTEVTPGVLPPGLRDRKKDKGNNGRGNGNGNGNGNGRGNNGNGNGKGNK